MNSEVTASTIPGLLYARTQETPRADACFRHDDAQGWIPETWAALWERVQSVALAFRALGLRKGDRLAILARTCPEWQVAEMAALSCGAVVVGVDPHASGEQIEYMLRHSGACGLVVQDGHKIDGMWEVLQPGIRFVVTLDPDASPGNCTERHSWRSLVSARTPPRFATPAAVDADDPAVVLYTSGTTGCPKAIEYTHRQLLVACRAIIEAFPGIDPTDRVLCWLPMAHLFQRMMNLVAIARGAKTYFVEDPREVMANIREVQPSIFVAVPRFYEKLHEGIMESLANSPRVVKRLAEAALNTGIAFGRRRREGRPVPLGLRIRHRILDALVLSKMRGLMGGNIKFMITGSAPTPPRLLDFFHGIGMLALEAYGLSENTVPMAANRPDAYRFGSVGKPFAGNEIRFARDGELEVCGPGVFGGYLHDEEPSERFTADGYYRTGDFGHCDPDGFLYLTGRKSDIIKTSTGRRISPARPEAVYCQSPYIDQMVVFGDGHKYLVGLVAVNRAACERELARVGIGDGQTADSKAIEALICREIESFGKELSAHERIANFAILPEPLSIGRGELTPTLKVRRDRVAALHADVIEQLHGERAEPDRTIDHVQTMEAAAR